MKTYAYILLFFLAIGITSCEKFLDYPPEGAIEAEDALNTPDDAQRLLNSCYDVLANVFDGSYQNLAELMSDNLAYPNGLDFQAVYNRQTNFFTPTTNGVYADFYYTIYRCNSLLLNFDLIEGLSESERSRMEAEARFIRALCHWHVAKLWAQPYGYSTDNGHLGIVIREKASNEPLARSTVAEVYDFILEDLAFARENLPAENGVYASRPAATALLGMVYFYQNKFTQAEAYLTEAIDNSGAALSDTIDRFPSLDGVALDNPETIFGIVSQPNDVRTDDLIGNYNAGGVLPPNLTLSADFNLVMNQNAADDRLQWVVNAGSQYRCTKYQDKVVFDVPIIYLTELKLLRAEAIAENLGDLAVARQDINDIRDRAFGPGVNPVPESASAEEIIEAARLEYRKETVAEGKWIDQLKRRGALGEDIVIRDAPWNCPGMALQFPNNEFTSALFVGNPEGGCN